MERTSLFRNSPALLTRMRTSSVLPQNNNNHYEISGPPTAVILDDDDVHSCMTEFSIMPPEVMIAKESSSSPLSVQNIAQVFQQPQPRSPVPVPRRSYSLVQERETTTIQEQPVVESSRLPIITKRGRRTFNSSFLTHPKLQLEQAGSSDDHHAGSKNTNSTSTTNSNPAVVSAESSAMPGEKTCSTSISSISKPEATVPTKRIPSNVNESSKAETQSAESKSKSAMTPEAESSTTPATSRSETTTCSPAVVSKQVSEPSSRSRKEVRSSHSQQRVSQLLKNWDSAGKQPSGGKPSEHNNFDDTTEISEGQPPASSIPSAVEELICLGGRSRKSPEERQDERDDNTTLFQEQHDPLGTNNKTAEPKDNASSAVEALQSEQESKRSLVSAAATTATAAECQQESNAAVEQKEDSSVILPPRAADVGSSPDTKSGCLTKAEAKSPSTAVRRAFERNLRSARSDSLAYLFANRPVSQGVENWKGKLSRSITSEPRERNNVTAGQSVGSVVKGLPVVASDKSSKGEETDETRISDPNNKENAVNNSESPERRRRRMSSAASQKGKQQLRSRRMRISGDDDTSSPPRLSTTRLSSNNNSEESSTISRGSAVIVPKEEKRTANSGSHGSSFNDTLQKRLVKALEKIAELSKAHDADRAQWQVSTVELVRVKKENEAGMLEGYRQRMQIEDYENAITQKDFQLGSLEARLTKKEPENKSLSSAGEMEKELQSTVAKLTVENRRLFEERDAYQNQSRLQKEEIETMDDLESFLRKEVEEYKNMLDVAEKGHEVAEKRVDTMEKSERMDINRAAMKEFEKVAEPHDFQKLEIDRLTIENRQLLEERESLETTSRLIHKEEVDAFEKRQMETDSKVSVLRKEAAHYKALFQAAQDDRGVSKSRISVSEKELQNISQALNNSSNDEAVTSELTDEELNESTEPEVSRKRLESMEEELQRSTGEVAGSKEAVEELKKINEMQTQENNRLTMETRQLLEERESMQIQIRERIEEIETQENRLNETESKESLLRKEIEDYRTIIEVVQGDYLASKKVSEELTKKNELQTENINRLTKESRQLLEERDLTQTQLRERMGENETLHNMQKEAGSQESLDRKQVEEYKSLLEIAKDDNEEYMKGIEEMEKDLEKIAHDLECANSEVAGSKKDVDELSKTNGLQKEENDRLRNDLETQSGRLQSQSEQLSSSEELTAHLTAEAEVWDKERKTLKEALKKQDGKVEALSKESSQIRQDSQTIKTSLRVELESSEAERTVLNDETLEETKGVELLKNESEKAPTSIEEAQKTLALLAEECESLRGKEQEQLEKITSLENQIKDATSAETADNVDLSELLVEEKARCELAEKEVETSRDRIEHVEHSLKAQQEWASIYQKSIEFLEEKIIQLEDTQEAAPVLNERSEPSCWVDEELQMLFGKQTLEDHGHETQQDNTVEANKYAMESNSSTVIGGPRAADGIHLNQADYIKSIVTRQKGAGAPNIRGWAPRLSGVFSRVPGMNGSSVHDPARTDSTLEAQNVKLQSDLVKLQAFYKDESYNNRKKLKELEEENLAILKKLNDDEPELISERSRCADGKYNC